MSKERGIIMTGESVVAILSGAKSMTRRIVKPQPAPYPDGGFYPWPNSGSCLTWDDVLEDPGYYVKCGYCPHGAPGDRLRVRETWRKGLTDNGLAVEYRADGGRTYLDDYPDNSTDWYWLPDMPWRSPLFMPRWASRITLEIVNVRVERVQDISEDDAVQEGVKGVHKYDDPVARFKAIWDSINARRPGCSWADNPFCWCLSFRRTG